MDEDDHGHLSAPQFVGVAKVEDGEVNVGGVRVQFDGFRGYTAVYVRRMVAPYMPEVDGQVYEIAMAQHSGLAAEELQAEKELAEQHPLGAAGYYRIQGDHDELMAMGLTPEMLQVLDKAIAEWQAERQDLEAMLDEGGPE